MKTKMYIGDILYYLCGIKRFMVMENKLGHFSMLTI